MSLQQVHQKKHLSAFLRSDPALYLYHLGDLDDFYWPKTTWYGWVENERLEAVLLIYRAFEPHIALALAPNNHKSAMRNLLGAAIPLLPNPVYFHISTWLKTLVEEAFSVSSHGLHLRMLLSNPKLPPTHPGVQPLTLDDLPAIQRLLTLANPENAFDAGLLPTGHFFGTWAGGELVSMAGIHVHSTEQRVAALGNVATHPAYRGKGLARQTTAAVIRSLLPDVDEIGLNVKTENAPAVGLYQSLGFTEAASFYEWTAWRKEGPVSGS